MKKVYLDNNIVSALGKEDTPQESKALLTILQAFDASDCDVCTSKVTGDEIEKYQGDKKDFIQAIYRLLKKVPYVENQKLLGIHSYGDRYSWIASPMIEDDPIWSKLLSKGVDQVDAHHLMLAIRGSCDVFLTADSGLLSKASQIEQEFQIRIMKPSEFVGEISKN